MANWQARPHPSLSIATRQFATRPPHSSHQVPGGTGRSIQPQHVLPSPSVARIVASHASRAPDSEIKNGERKWNKSRRIQASCAARMLCSHPLYLTRTLQNHPSLFLKKKKILLGCNEWEAMAIA
uniref:Uncharacterized protein n=1 Tax=Setaria viridis TaxID=4556 RepID=A0A4U6UAE3_SETVI|nr:hypothetical protein SEVIR_6G165300v2 [Setaria viridis]